MKKPVLKVKIRNEVGKGYARRLRRKGFVPVILYGPHLENSVPLEVELLELRSFLSSFSGESKIITLQFTDENKNDEREVIIKDRQYNWIKGKLEHLDFYEITRGEIISTKVSLHLVGESAGVKKGGVIEQMVREIEVECLPKDIPPHIDVDLTELEIGDSLRVKDIQSFPGVKILTNVEEVFVSILSPISEEELEKLEEEIGVVAEEVEVIEKERKEEVGEEEEEPTKKEE